jgi:hypothetical protein
MKTIDSEIRYALCIEHKDSEDLEKRKIYQVIPDEDVIITVLYNIYGIFMIWI